MELLKSNAYQWRKILTQYPSGSEVRFQHKSRYGHRSVLVGGKIYVVGGSLPVDRYICELDIKLMHWTTWEERANDLTDSSSRMKNVLGENPIRRSNPSVALADDKIFIFCGSGVDSGDLNSAVQCFDLVTKELFNCGGSNLLGPSMFGQCTGYFRRRREILLFGGKDSKGLRNSEQMLAFNVDKRAFVEYSTRGNRPPPLTAAGFCSDEERLFVFGGALKLDRGGTPCDYCDYLYVLAVNKLRWERIARLDGCVWPSARRHTCLTMLPGRLCLMGGIPNSDEYFFDLDSHQWIALIHGANDDCDVPYLAATLNDDGKPSDLYNEIAACAVFANDKILQIGGYVRGSLEAVWSFEPAQSD